MPSFVSLRVASKSTFTKPLLADLVNTYIAQPMKLLFLAVLLTLLTTACVHRGYYMVQGTYDKVSVDFTDTKIGIIDPRGVFGDEEALQSQKRGFKQLTKCDRVLLLSESDLRFTSTPPPPYGEVLTDADFEYLQAYTDLDYLIFSETGPGRAEPVPGSGFSPVAAREAYAFLALYDLNTGEELKTITVNGSLNPNPDANWFEVYYDEESIARRALLKAVRRLVEYATCG